MAADVIFSDGRSILDAMMLELSALARRRWIVLGATAVLWAAGLLARVSIPASASAAVAQQPAQTSHDRAIRPCRGMSAPITSSTATS